MIIDVTWSYSALAACLSEMSFGDLRTPIYPDIWEEKKCLVKYMFYTISSSGYDTVWRDES